VVLFVGLGCHVLGRADVVEDLRPVGHLLHGAVPEVNDRYGVSSLLPEKDVIGLQVTVNDLFVSDSLVA